MADEPEADPLVPGRRTGDALLVRHTTERGVAVLTLDSPRNRNALSTRLMDELEHELRSAAKDPAIRAVLLGHTGNVFCAGADLAEATEDDPLVGPRRMVALLRAIVESPKPVVARITGHVRAGGLGLAGACDIAVAGPGATFAFTEARLGLAPAVISLPLLPRLDPRAVSRYYLTGETFDAAEAARIGLVSAAADDVDAALAPVLDGLRSASPQGLAESKRLSTSKVLRAFDEEGEALVHRSGQLFSSPQAQEGMRAFLERRAPSWTRPR